MQAVKGYLAQDSVLRNEIQSAIGHCPLEEEEEDIDYITEEFDEHEQDDSVVPLQVIVRDSFGVQLPDTAIENTFAARAEECDFGDEFLTSTAAAEDIISYTADGDFITAHNSLGTY